MSADPTLLVIEWAVFRWLGAAQAAASEGFKTAMIAIWSAGLWLIEMTMRLVDVFLTPDLSAAGPARTMVPLMMGVALCLAAVLVVAQLTSAVIRRDGKALGETLLGVLQFALAWAGYLTAIGVGAVAAQGLTHAILDAGLRVQSFGEIDLTKSFPRQVSDNIAATLLGLLTPFLVLPAGVGLILAMMTRTAALLVLVSVSPINIAGLLHGRTNRWFWVANRWLLAALFMPVLMGIVLSLGVQVMGELTAGAGSDTITGSAQAVGTAVVGMLLFLITAICPLMLFRLFAFVDPGTTTGAAFRQGLAANGWLGSLAGGGQPGGQAAAAVGGGSDGGSGEGQGLSAGEEKAQEGIVNRLAPVLAGLNNALMGAARTAGAVGGDVLNQAGIGHQQHVYGDQQQTGSSGGRRRQGDDDPNQDGDPPSSQDPGPFAADDPGPGAAPSGDADDGWDGGTTSGPDGWDGGAPAPEVVGAGNAMASSAPPPGGWDGTDPTPPTPASAPGTGDAAGGGTSPSPDSGGGTSAGSGGQAGAGAAGARGAAGTGGSGGSGAAGAAGGGSAAETAVIVAV